MVGHIDTKIRIPLWILASQPRGKIPNCLWIKWSETISKTVSRRVPVDKLHSKKDRFSKDFKAFENLLTQSDLGLDPVNGRFDYDEYEWKKILEVMVIFFDLYSCQTYLIYVIYFPLLLVCRKILVSLYTEMDYKCYTCIKISLKGTV